MKAGIYARVSTKDKGQELENQLRQLREFAAAQGWTIFREYVSGASWATVCHETGLSKGTAQARLPQLAQKPRPAEKTDRHSRGMKRTDSSARTIRTLRVALAILLLGAYSSRIDVIFSPPIR